MEHFKLRNLELFLNGIEYLSKLFILNKSWFYHEKYAKYDDDSTWMGH